MGLLDRLIHGTGAVCRAGALVCGGLCVLVSFVIAVAVVMRKVFNVSIVGADEISSFILAASCSWGFAFALLHRAHVRVESLQLVLPRRLCAILDIVGLILLGAFVAVIAWYTANVLALSIDMGALADMLDVPLWFPQGVLGRRLRRLGGSRGSPSHPLPGRVPDRRPGCAAGVDRVALRR